MRRFATVAALLAAITTPLHAAEDPHYLPRAEAQLFYSSLSVSGEARNPNGGFGGKASLRTLFDLDLIADGSFNTIETSSIDIDSTQYRAGLRKNWTATNESPVYSSVSVQYAHYELDAKGLPSDSESLPLFQVRAGYRTRKAHFYGEFGYGPGSQLKVSEEFIVGFSHSVLSALPHLDVFGEYRTTRLEPDDSDGRHIRYKDLRIGLGYHF
ncbi:MAG: outer membrane beta-barrel protein [Pseudomonadota bacterium]